MIKKILFLFCLFGLSCTSDDIIRSEKTSFYKIYKDIVLSEPTSTPSKGSMKRQGYDKAWLSRFNQPIILLSSLDGKKTATLVALGNYKDKLTWVSADGISVSFLNGVLVATRGYSQDLMESQQTDLNIIFTQNVKTRSKKYRYINGENRYIELNFNCTLLAKTNTPSVFFNLTIETTKFKEICRAGSVKHTNEYYVLPGTNIVLKSVQWISEANGSIIIYNYYAFQNNL